MAENTNIYLLNTLDVDVIPELAERIWWPTYYKILSAEQIRFMLDKMFNPDALIAEMVAGTQFYVARLGKRPVGFLGVNITKSVLRIEKIYIDPEQQNKGLGKNLIHHTIKLAQESACSLIELNVNRKNPSLGFYRHLGFEIIKEVDIPYHKFMLNDYILHLKINED